MPDRIVEIDGVRHSFPSDATDDEIASALGGSSTPYEGGGLARHALSGDPGGYPEGVDPTQSTSSRIGRALQPLANPKSATDIGRLLMGPTDVTRSAMAYAPAVMKQAGSMARVAGNLISRTHLHPVKAALDFNLTKPFKTLGNLISVDDVKPPPSYNPLANMGQGPRPTPQPPTAPQPTMAKPSFSAQEVLKVKLLIQQGLSQERAIAMVKGSP